MPKNQVITEAKLAYFSKSFIGGTLSTGGAILYLIKLLSGAPELEGKSAFDKYWPLVAFAASGLMTNIGSADRNDLFFRRSKLREAVEETAERFTVKEAIDTGVQAFGVATAPADQRWDKAAQFAVDTQRRWETNNTFPEYHEDEEVIDSGQPQLESFAPDVRQSVDGVLENY